MAVIFLAALLYGPVSIGANGRTLGKRVLKVHVVGDEGRAPSYPTGRGARGRRQGAADRLARGAAVARCPDRRRRSPRRHGVGGGRHLRRRSARFRRRCVRRHLDRAALRRRPHRTLHDRMAGTVCVAGTPVSRTAEAPRAAPAARASDVPAR